MPIYRPEEFVDTMSNVASGASAKTGVPNTTQVLKSIFDMAMSEESEGDGFIDRLKNQVARQIPKHVKGEQQAKKVVDSMIDYYKGYGDVETIKRVRAAPFLH